MFSFTEFINRENRTLVMGILNITPDSFSDGGDYFSPSSALEAAKRMVSEGASVIDIGGCSTAPMNTEASSKEELLRLKSVLPLISDNIGVPISVDTKRPEAARFALENGASVINDESGFFNKEMASLVKSYGAGWIVMHTGGLDSANIGEYPRGVVSDVKKFFNNMKKDALSYGIDESALCYDYGIGFGKSRADDLTLLKAIAEFKEFAPLLVGVSRKRLIGEITGRKLPKDRTDGSVAAAVLAAYGGASIIRAHDVKATYDALLVADAVKRGTLIG